MNNTNDTSVEVSHMEAEYLVNFEKYKFFNLFKMQKIFTTIVEHPFFRPTLFYNWNYPANCNPSMPIMFKALEYVSEMFDFQHNRYIIELDLYIAVQICADRFK